MLPVHNLKDSEIGDIARSKNVGDRQTYITSNAPIDSENYLFGGTSYTIIGMEYGDHQYGYQFALGVKGIKYRNKNQNVWNDWKSL